MGSATPPTVNRDGFSLNASVACRPEERKRLERRCRNVARPPLALERLGRDGDGLVAPRLKHPFRDGATEFLFEQLDFLARLVALKPRPRGHLRRYHGVLAPNLRHRRLVVSAPLPTPPGQDDESTPAHARAPMNSMQRPRYVFDIDLHQYSRCGAALRVLAVIADPPAIATMLEHIDTRAAHRFFPLTHLNRTPVHSAAVATTSALGHLVSGSARPPPPCQQTPSSRVSHRRYRAHRRPPSIPHDSHTDLRDTAHRRRYGPLEFLSACRYPLGDHSLPLRDTLLVHIRRILEIIATDLVPERPHSFCNSLEVDPECLRFVFRPR